MHYVIGDIHNDLKKLKQILKQINITRDDELIVLGDVFDRGGETADPFGVYCALAGLQGKCSWIRGNHDDWLANYTYEYFNTPEKKRHKLAPYGYNSFELLRQRITEVDMRNIADLIKGLPLQKELELEGKKYLFAHAMTSHPDVREEDRYYMRGTMDIDCFSLKVSTDISPCAVIRPRTALCGRRTEDIWTSRAIPSGATTDITYIS